MLRITVNVSRKTCPEQFESVQAGCSLEKEVADGIGQDALRAEIAALYGVAEQAVQEQLQKAAGVQGCNGAEAAQPRTPRIPAGNGNGHGNGQRGNRGGRTVMATAAQKKAIAAICKDQGLEVADVLADWDGDADKLTVKEASGVIDALKGKPAGNGSRR